MPSCFICERELKSVNDVRQYVHSTHTGNHYCLPGEGCWTDPNKITEPSAAPINVAAKKSVVKVSKPRKREKVQHLNVPFLGS